MSEEAEMKVKRVEGGRRRLAVLCHDQVSRLNDVMNDMICIQGRGNFPTIEVQLKDLVTVVRAKLEEDGSHLKVADIRLNGGCASYVLATETDSAMMYNDLDLIFAVDLGGGRHFDRVKQAVLNSLLDLLPAGVSRKRMSTCSLKEAYVSKMVKVNNETDCWSLIALGTSRGHKNVELKFVDAMKRPFEFSVDSFQIILDSLFVFYECSSMAITENFYPTVVGESVYGDFQEALHHLRKKLIATRNPEEIRGGGLLKYCHLLVKDYKPAEPDKIKTLERYMCSRFFIDFPNISQQRSKLENYLWNHFIGPEEESLKYQYLLLLRNVVDESTVCLMNHERMQTLALINDLAYQAAFASPATKGQAFYHHNIHHHPHHHHHHQTAPTYVYSNGYYYPYAPNACLYPSGYPVVLPRSSPSSSASSTSSKSTSSGKSSSAASSASSLKSAASSATAKSFASTVSSDSSAKSAPSSGSPSKLPSASSAKSTPSAEKSPASDSAKPAVTTKSATTTPSSRHRKSQRKR